MVFVIDLLLRKHSRVLPSEEIEYILLKSKVEKEKLMKSFHEALPVDLENLEIIEKKMTAGPWRQCSASDSHCPCGLIWSLAVDQSIGTVKQENDGESANNSDDAIGIAAIRNALPAMIAELRDLRQIMKEIGFI